MIDITIITKMLTQFYFSKYLFMASVIYGIFKLVKSLIYR